MMGLLYRYAILLALIFVGSGHAVAQTQRLRGASNNDRISIKVPIRDAVTRERLNDLLFSGGFEVRTVNDSTVVGKSSIIMDDCAFGTFPTGGDKQYLIRTFANYIGEPGIAHREYEDCWFTINVDPEKKSLELPEVYLKRKQHQRLREVEVTATKVQLYYKGDTLVYNADAFIVADGSMLDALLDQLPGVTMDGNGVIKCNGRKVDNLLLNGRDVFNGNIDRMIENLAAYTVKDIAVYDKMGKLSDLVNANMGDATYVMDVRLKKEYSHGYVANLEAGYGSSNRYLAKAFGLWFSDYVSVTAYLGANNLSDHSKPGQTEEAWAADKMGDGVKTSKYGGLTYLAQTGGKKLEIKGDVEASITDVDKRQMQSLCNYFASGDIYGYTSNISKTRMQEINTSHQLYCKLSNRSYVNVTPYFRYRHNKSTGQILSVTMNQELSEVSKDLLQSIYDNAEDYAETMVTRSKNRELSRGPSLEGGGKIFSELNLNAGSDPLILSVDFDVDFQSRNNERFSSYSIKQRVEADPYYNYDRYFRNHPDSDSKYEGGVGLQKHFMKWISSGSRSLAAKYTYTNESERRTSDYFILSDVPTYDEFGRLPSYTEYSSSYSPSDSYASFLTQHNHTLNLKCDLMGLSIGSIGLSVRANLPVTMKLRRLRYDGYGVNEVKHRTDVLFDPFVSVNARFSINSAKLKQWNVYFTMRSMQKEVNMSDIVGIQNATDPMNVFMGNPDLKNTRKSEASIGVTVSDFPMHELRLHYGYERMDKAISRGLFYNPVSGVKTYRMYNIGGNWSSNAYFQYEFDKQQRKRVNITTKTEARLVNSVDLSGVSLSMDEMPPIRNVRSMEISEMLKFNWKTGRHRVSAHAEGRVNRYFSSDAGFTDFTSWMCKYGATAVLNLPKNWGVSTDLTLYTRRGFADGRLNTTDLVWNARLTKSILGGSLVFVADCYDLLHQLSNIAYTVNAQARTETVSNVIPSYVLVHVQWRFNKQPKR